MTASQDPGIFFFQCDMYTHITLRTRNTRTTKLYTCFEYNFCTVNVR